MRRRYHRCTTLAGKTRAELIGLIEDAFAEIDKLNDKVFMLSGQYPSADFRKRTMEGLLR